MIRSVIIGTGSCVPKRVLTNGDLEKLVDTSNEWITSRTGIEQRRIAGIGEETSKLAAVAAQRALKMATVNAEELDLIIVGTITPEMVMPSCACLVQKEIGALHAFAFDLNAACSGFAYGLEVADRYIKNDPDMKVLLIGAETLSGRVDWQDRNTCVLFGDGAGACVVTGSTAGHGLLASQLYSDGRLWELLSLANTPRRYCPGGDYEFGEFPLEEGKGATISMAGPDVFKFAVRSMDQAVRSLLAEQEVSVDQIDLVVPHQANVRILKSLAERLGLPFSKVFTTIAKYGNTSAASVPIALDEVNRQGGLPKGSLVLMVVFGGGFTWGCALIRW